MALCGVLALGVALPARLTVAQPAATGDKEAKKKAAARFKEGEALFQKHAYAEAAQAFEDAYNIAPHPAVMLNAINAWSIAGQPARAATLTSALVADRTIDDKSREEARSKMAELQGKVGRVNIRGAQPKKLTVDGKTVAMGEVFVDPGDHLIEADMGDRKVQRKVSVVAGSSEQILLEGPASPAPSTAPTTPATSSPTSASTSTAIEPERPRKGLPPVVVYVGAGVTAVLGGVLIWSGLDTLKARDEFDDKVKARTATQSDKDAGESKQTRTNILLGVTAAAGLATVGIALFATNWGGDKKSTAQLRVGPGSLSIGGAF